MCYFQFQIDFSVEFPARYSKFIFVLNLISPWHICVFAPKSIDLIIIYRLFFQKKKKKKKKITFFSHFSRWFSAMFFLFFYRLRVFLSSFDAIAKLIRKPRIYSKSSSHIGPARWARKIKSSFASSIFYNFLLEFLFYNTKPQHSWLNSNMIFFKKKNLCKFFFQICA